MKIVTSNQVVSQRQSSFDSLLTPLIYRFISFTGIFRQSSSSDCMLGVCRMKFLIWFCDITCQVGVQGNEWTDLILEATTEVLKLGSAPFALLFQALLQFTTKMDARSVSSSCSLWTHLFINPDIAGTLLLYLYLLQHEVINLCACVFKPINIVF